MPSTGHRSHCECGGESSFRNSPILAIILTYGKRGQHLERVLDALCDGHSVPDTILVIDNGSTSDADRSRQRPVPVRWLDLPKNLGSAGGYRAGLVEAANTHAHAWLLDDDNLPEPGCLAALELAACALGPDAVVAAHRPERPEFRDIIARGGTRPFRRDSFMAFHILGMPTGQTLGVREGCLPLGCFGYGGALVPASVLAKGILPEEALFIYHDDSDWSHRLLDAGATAWLVPQAHIRDLEVSWGGKPSLGASPLFSRAIDASRTWYAIRNRAWMERRMGFGGPLWHLHAAMWIGLQGLRALAFERSPLECLRRVRIAAAAFRAGAARRLDPMPRP